MHPAMPKLAALFNTDRKLAFVGTSACCCSPPRSRSTTRNRCRCRRSSSRIRTCRATGRAASRRCRSRRDGAGAWRTCSTPSNGGSALPLCVSVSGSNQFMVAGQPDAAPYQVSPNGPIKIRAWRDWDTNNANPQKVYNDRIVVPRFNMLEDEYSDIVARSIDTELAVTAALAPIGSFRADFPGTGTDAQTIPRSPIRLSNQLRMVARLIAARADFRRQAAGLLRVARRVRHAWRPARARAEASGACSTSARRVLSQDRGAGRGVERHDVHCIGLRKHLHVQRQRLRSWMGRASPRGRRLGRGWPALRHVPGRGLVGRRAHADRSGEQREPRRRPGTPAAERLRPTFTRRRSRNGWASRRPASSRRCCRTSEALEQTAWDSSASLWHSFVSGSRRLAPSKTPSDDGWALCFEGA